MPLLRVAEGEAGGALPHDQDFLDQLNENVSFVDPTAGEPIWAPNVREASDQDRPDIARVVVSIRGNTFNAFDAGRQSDLPRPDDARIEVRPVAERDGGGEEGRRSTRTSTTSRRSSPKSRQRPGSQPEPRPELTVGVVWIALIKAALRRPRHLGPGLDRLRVVPRLRAADELGREGSGAPDLGGRADRVSGYSRECLGTRTYRTHRTYRSYESYSSSTSYAKASAKPRRDPRILHISQHRQRELLGSTTVCATFCRSSSVTASMCSMISSGVHCRPK